MDRVEERVHIHVQMACLIEAVIVVILRSKPELVHGWVSLMVFVCTGDKSK